MDRQGVDPVVRRALVSAAVLAALGVSALALEPVVPPGPPRNPHTSIALVVDVSASVRRGRLGELLAQARMVAEQPIDEYRLCVYQFAGGFARDPRGWRDMPDETAVDELEEWIRGGMSGTTAPAAPVAAACLEHEPDLLVVLVTDGMFSSSRALESAWGEAQEARKARGHRPADFGAIVVGDQAPASLYRIAEAERGGLYFTQRPAPVPAEPAPVIPWGQR